MVLAKIVYIIEPLPYAMTKEERADIKELLTKYANKQYPFVSSRDFVAVQANIDAVGLDALLRAIRRKKLRCSELRLTANKQSSLNDLLLAAPIPQEVKFIYTSKR